MVGPSRTFGADFFFNVHRQNDGVNDCKPYFDKGTVRSGRRSLIKG